MTEHPEKIYKVVTETEWRDAMKEGVFKGAPIDLADGYIHFSTADQVEETVEKHFKGQRNLLLVTFETKRLGDPLKWEPSRGGALFPHLYDVLDTALASAVARLQEREDGGHVFPKHY